MSDKTLNSYSSDYNYYEAALQEWFGLLLRESPGELSPNQRLVTFDASSFVSPLSINHILMNY